MLGFYHYRNHSQKFEYTHNLAIPSSSFSHTMYTTKSSVNPLKLPYHSQTLLTTHTGFKNSNQQVNDKKQEDFYKQFSVDCSQSLQSNPDENFISPINNLESLKADKEKKIVRFTLLDDDELQDLDEAINGPKSKQEEINKQEAMRQAYERMKQEYEQYPLDSSDSRNSSNYSVKQQEKPQNTERGQNLKCLKENKNLDNLPSNTQIKNRIAKQPNEVKVPRIMIRYKTINLLDPPKQEQFYALGLKNYTRQTRAPQNSFITKNEQWNLFGQALEQKKGHSQSNKFSHFHTRS